ncbi:hypothetical protein A2U01_0060794, partial [Trifolium medium]|nr:hypothetical protein [Trifolium medium]
HASREELIAITNVNSSSPLRTAVSHGQGINVFKTQVGQSFTNTHSQKRRNILRVPPRSKFEELTKITTSSNEHILVRT